MPNKLSGKGTVATLLLMILLVLSASAGTAQESGHLVATPKTTSLADASLIHAKEIDASTPVDPGAFYANQGIPAAQFEDVSVIVTYEEGVNSSLLEASTSGHVIHNFQLFNGASLVVDGEKVESLASLKGVTGVYLDRLMQPDTDSSPGFVGAPVFWNELGGPELAGSGVTVGIIDTGIWPEHPSYADPDPHGDPYPVPPVMPGANGFAATPRSTCDFGNTNWNINDAPFECNNKLIGAYDFTDTYKSLLGLKVSEYSSARDANGHGTHTSSTATGNGAVSANVFGVPHGTVTGIAPRAHVIMYKVCNDAGCYQSDSLAAIEQAILDEVDILNFSISGGADPFQDIVEQAFSVAYENGVFVAASAGNSGGALNTVAHRGPWTTTVAASTSNRQFMSTVTLAGDEESLTLEGSTLTNGLPSPVRVVLPPAGQESCSSAFPVDTFNGEIVICRRGGSTRVAKSYHVAVGGAGGMLLYNPSEQDLAADNHFLPSVHLDYAAGQSLLELMANHEVVSATISASSATVTQGDVMASFSSKGGPGQKLGISKPDITAPGVQIFAGHTPTPASISGGATGQLFRTMQGTSMSSPIVAGSAALVKALHPDWTPGQIKSALMMTANGNLVKQDGHTPAGPFNAGSGRVDLNRLTNPGLTISDSVESFNSLKDELWNTNYPSLYVPDMPGQITVKRTIHSELLQSTTWQTVVDSPADLTVHAPESITIAAGADRTFDITVDARHVPIGEYRSATLFLTNDEISLRFPITIVRAEPALTLDKECTPTTLDIGNETHCNITISNNSYQDSAFILAEDLPSQLTLVEGGLEGAIVESNHAFTIAGQLSGANDPSVKLEPLTLFGFQSMAELGFSPAGCPSNCDDGAFLVSGLDITYMGEHYTEGLWSVNGTFEMGTTSGVSASFFNQNLPDPAAPNNILAPWWADLNLGDGGNWYIGAVTDGERSWDVLEWENVPRFGDPASTFTFQIWLERGTDHITFAYGPFCGDTSKGTTGAENGNGSNGESLYVDGVGTLPWGGPDIGVSFIPSRIGESRTITYSAIGDGPAGPWTSCTELTGDLFQGANVTCTYGELLPSNVQYTYLIPLVTFSKNNTEE